MNMTLTWMVMIIHGKHPKPNPSPETALTLDPEPNPNRVPHIGSGLSQGFPSGGPLAMRRIMD